ncbi:MAG TPA: helix-turn-helix domain-containing protein [Candidatus Saccharimonadales bacterium]|nr:helix-turn-helix domain-containing protein [Candidatus Saccharimonadales bacterium]
MQHEYPVRAYFEKLGLEADIADLYMALHTFGPQTISQLARSAKVERTRIYRMIDRLSESHLIETETHYSRTILKAAPIGNLQLLLTQKEEELKSLKNELKDIRTTLDSTSLSSPLTHIQFYRGAEGVKQMMWNQTKATSENVAILYENMQNRTNSAYFERWVERANSNNQRFRGIIGDHFIKTQQEWYARHTNERLEHWQSRYVSDFVFPITHSTIIYDDVVGYFNWKDGEVFGIEIYNQEIANAQRQFFEMLWEQAQPVDDVEGIAAG